MKSRPALVETSVEGEVFTHRILWSSSRRQMRAAEERPSESWYFHMSAMLLGFMAFEAYVNFLGSRLLPDLWEDERNNFREMPYKGTRGKLLKLCEEYGVAFPTKGRRPYQSVARLNELRDIVAHGKPDKVSFTVRHRAGANPATIQYSLDNYISEKKAQQALNDLKEMVDSLHSSFAAKAGIDLVYPLAFDGTLAMAIGHMSDET